MLSRVSRSVISAVEPNVTTPLGSSSGVITSARSSSPRRSRTYVPLFLLAIVALKLNEPEVAFENPYLLLLLNFLFSFVASSFVIALGAACSSQSGSDTAGHVSAALAPECLTSGGQQACFSGRHFATRLH